LAERLMQARNAFMGAREASLFIVGHQSKFSDGCLGAMVAGAIATYTRPFLESKGLGPLSRKYKQFPNEPDFEECHNEAMDSRDSLYVHFSPDEAHALAKATGSVGSCKVGIKKGRANSGHILLASCEGVSGENSAQ
jgi:hypothetical protein